MWEVWPNVASFPVKRSIFADLDRFRRLGARREEERERGDRCDKRVAKRIGHEEVSRPASQRERPPVFNQTVSDVMRRGVRTIQRFWNRRAWHGRPRQ